MEGILPKSITLLGKKFKVKVFNNNVCGMMDYENATIYYNPKAHTNNRQLLHTFWHEIFHALHYRLGLHQCLSPDVLEILAETQAELIIEFFYPSK
jgi:hypothetical protein